MQQEKYHPALNLLMVALILLGLYLGKDLLVPLVLAIVVWYLINTIGANFGRIKFGSKQMPRWLRTTLAVLFVFSFFWFIGRMVINNLEEFVEVAPEYNAKFVQLTHEISQKTEIPTIHELSKEIHLGQLASDTFNSSLNFLTALFVVLFYVIFLFFEQEVFKKKIDLMFRGREDKVNYFRITRRIDASMKSYLGVKSFIALLAAVCDYIVFISFDLDFAILWAFLAFLLNFIPFVGALIAILFPTILSLIQFGDPVITVAIFIILNVIQVIIGNFLEPKMVGKSLNLSPLVVILSLAFWGALWGVAGMFLCVPITVALMIIFSQFPKTRRIAILLSAGNDPSKAARIVKH
ncbi:MAG: AI-2E family transporter [Crocinitomicaceae bacterium]|nr:AI-2E family transporter [Crocinitomicaceae bacterium]